MQGYDLLLKQVRFELVSNTFYFVLAIVGLIFSIRLLVKYGEINKDISFHATKSDWMMFTGWIGVTLCGMVVLILPPFILNALINPDWVAIKMLLDIIP